ALPVSQPCSSLRAARWSILWSERCRRAPCKNTWTRYLVKPNSKPIRGPGYNTTSRCLYGCTGAGHGGGPPESHARHRSQWDRDTHPVASRAQTSSLWWDSVSSVRRYFRENKPGEEFAYSAEETPHSSIRATVTHGPCAASTAGGALVPWPRCVHTHGTAAAPWTRASEDCTGRPSTAATSGSSYSGAAQIPSHQYHGATRPALPDAPGLSRWPESTRPHGDHGTFSPLDARQ